MPRGLGTDRQSLSRGRHLRVGRRGGGGECTRWVDVKNISLQKFTYLNYLLSTDISVFQLIVKCFVPRPPSRSLASIEVNCSQYSSLARSLASSAATVAWDTSRLPASIWTARMDFGVVAHTPPPLTRNGRSFLLAVESGERTLSREVRQRSRARRLVDDFGDASPCDEDEEDGAGDRRREATKGRSQCRLSNRSCGGEGSKRGMIGKAVQRRQQAR